MALRNKRAASTDAAPEENLSKIVDMDGQPVGDDHKRRWVPDDDELAIELAEYWKDKVAFFHGSWHVYENGLWSKREDYEVQRNIRVFLRSYRKVGVKVTQRQVTGLLSMMRADVFRPDRSVNKAQLDSERYINMRNGLYDLEEHRLIPHTPAHAKLMMTSQLDFDYDEDASCPNFDKFLHSSLVYPGTTQTDHDMVALVQQALGYSLTAQTHLKASFWLRGVGDSGKSTLLALIKALMGNLADTIDLTQLATKSFMLAQIIGKRTVSFSEASSNTMLPEALYKAIVGGVDEIWADVKNGKAIVFKPIAKFWWAMNEMPRISDRSGATFNRLKLIRFNRSFSASERDLNLLPKLISERSGIFNNLIMHYRILCRDGWRHVAQSQELLDEYELENDTERSFVQDRCDVDPDFKVQSNIIYAAYNDWCMVNGFKPKNRNQFAPELRRLGFRDQKASTTWWHGVKVRPKV